MNAKERRELLKKQLGQRQEDAYRNKDDSGKFRSIFEKKIPPEKRFKCGEGDHSVDFIPYIAGGNDPFSKKGESTYRLDVFIHRKVGVNEDDYLCLNRNKMGKCPICEYQAQLQRQGDVDDAVIKALNPTRRAIYNIWSHDNSKEEAKGVQIWDTSQYLFDSNLSEQAKMKKGGGFIPFPHPDDGKIVSFRRTGMSAMSTKYVAFSFEDRDEPIPDKILDQAMCLDEMLHIPTYDEVAEAFFSDKKDAAPKDEDEAPPKRKVSQEDDEEEAPKSRRKPVVEEDEEEEKPRARRKEPEPEEEEEEAPPKRRSRQVEEEDEDAPPPRKRAKVEDDEEEEKPRSRKAKVEEEEDDVAVNQCPEGFGFGSDFGQYDECDDCDMRKECRAEKKGGSKKEEEPAPPARRRRG